MYTFWYDIWYVISSNYALDTEMKNLLSQILVKEDLIICTKYL
jgi:hypothetical protein